MPIALFEASSKAACSCMNLLRTASSAAFFAIAAKSLFAFFAAVAAFGIGNLSQAGAVGGALAPLGAPPALVGLFLALLVGLVLGGGIVRVARFAQVVVPLKLLLFLVALGPLLVLYAGRIPEALDRKSTRLNSSHRT